MAEPQSELAVKCGRPYGIGCRSRLLARLSPAPAAAPAEMIVRSQQTDVDG